MAQAALEDNLRDRRDVSDVWWNDTNPYTPRVYLYGASHSDYEADEFAELDWEEGEQLIWPVEIEFEATPVSPLTLDATGTKMTLAVTTSAGKAEMTRVVPEEQWAASLVEHSKMIIMFAAEAAHGVAGALSPEEGL
jgi:hypothetical protein